MRKIVAYLATGVLLGVITMLLPLNLLPSLGPKISPASQGYLPPTNMTISPTDETTNYAERCPDNAYKGLSGTEQPKNMEIDRIDSIGMLPSSLLYAGLISVISLIFALGIYAFFKRRMAA